MYVSWVLYFTICQKIVEDRFTGFQRNMFRGEITCLFFFLSQHCHGNTTNTGFDWSDSFFAGCCFSVMSCYKDLPYRTVLSKATYGKQREQRNPYLRNLGFHLFNVNGNSHICYLCNLTYIICSLKACDQFLFILIIVKIFKRLLAFFILYSYHATHQY